MKNIRIWTETEKRCEAIWLNQLLTLCGYQTWKTIIDEKTYHYACDNRFHYLDILLLGNRSTTDYLWLVNRNKFPKIVVSGPVQKVNLLRNNFNILGASEMLNTDSRGSLEKLMLLVSDFVAKNTIERATLLKLTRYFVQRENDLSGAMYTITEMFCSRRINYLPYDNYGVLIYAIKDVEKWLQNYLENVELDLTYPELFAITYLKNLINEGYIKARRSGGYDTTELFRNANYLLHEEPDADAVLYLKLLILHNSINFSERPEDILEIIQKVSAPEYVGKAAGEVGDIYREEQRRISKYDLTDYYELLDERDAENYRSLYRYGLVLENMGAADMELYLQANEKYTMVIILIININLEDRTPQEFEYLYKAIYGKIKTKIIIDKYTGNFTSGKKEKYKKKINELVKGCEKFRSLGFWNIVYGNTDDYGNMIKLMTEKMEKMKGMANYLLKAEL